MFHDRHQLDSVVALFLNSRDHILFQEVVVCISLLYSRDWKCRREPRRFSGWPARWLLVLNWYRSAGGGSKRRGRK